MREIIRLVGIAAVFGGGLLAWAARSACGDDGQAPVRDPEHRVNVCVSNYRDLQRLNVVMQKRDYSCGAAALATILRYFWCDPVNENNVLLAIGDVLTIEEIKDRIKNGMAISDLRRAAVKMGYQSSIGTMSFQDLCGSRVPLIVPLKLERVRPFRGLPGSLRRSRVPGRSDSGQRPAHHRRVLLPVAEECHPGRGQAGRGNTRVLAAGDPPR